MTGRTACSIVAFVASPYDRSPRRRALLLAGSLSIALQTSLAQTAAGLPRVVMVLTSDERASRPSREGFVQGMQLAGHIEGRTYRFDVRLGNGEPARAAQHIRQAVADRPDVLVVAGLIAARLARDSTSTIPIVVATSGDLLDAGIVSSLARPGGNITGISDLADEASVKRLELIKAALPKATRVALLTNPQFPATPKIEARVEAAAPSLGLTITRIHVVDRAALRGAFDRLREPHPDALLVGGDSLLTANRADVIERASKLRIPVVYYWPGTAEQGALMSLQPDVVDNFRRAAGYVDKILKGARPGELPIQQPTRYELVVNAKVAKSLGLTLPQTLLLRADRVID